tara:strand:- start:380 stop:766 length:387 start_codon:yes stop_codon:yes gene_type:complete
MRYFTVFAYLLAAVINLAPSVGTLSNAKLTQLYAIPIESADLALLLRHRAVLFAIVGGYLFAAAFSKGLRTQAGIAGLVSMVSFILLFVLTGTDNANLLRVALIDSAAVLVLMLGLATHLLSGRLQRN